MNDFNFYFSEISQKHPGSFQSDHGFPERGALGIGSIHQGKEQ
jgi:hypothetical protein